MRTSTCLIASLILGACGGPADPDGGGVGPDSGRDAGPVLDCTGLEDGTMCGEGRVCVDGTCDLTRCGDGVTDPAAGEQCDDGNMVPFDGCESNCTRTCTDDAECEDG